MIFLQAEEMDMGEMLGWMQAFFETLGIWQTMQVAITISIVLATASLVINFVGSRR